MSLVLVGGLPGSGKSYLLGEFEHKGWKIFDDFQANAINDSPQFDQSRRFAELITDLRSGRPCVVADIRVIHEPYRASARDALTSSLSEAAVEFHLFENDAEQCAENVRRDAGREPSDRLRAIQHWTNQYSCPQGTRVMPVWRPRGNQA